MNLSHLLFTAFITFGATGGASVLAQTRNFDGGGDGSSWSDAANWSDNDIPDSVGETASIDTGGAWDVTSTGSGLSLGSLQIGGDDALTIGNNITVATMGSLLGEVTLSPGGQLTANSSWQNDGIITMNDFGFFGTPSSAHSGTNSATGLIRGQLFQTPLGFIVDTLFNYGTLSPGFTANDAALLTLTSDVMMMSTSLLDIEIGGGSTNFSFDTVAVQTAVLGGELKLTMFDGYVPAPSATLTIVESVLTNGITGSFTNVANGERLLTSDGSGSFLVNYGTENASSDVVISDFQPIPEPGAATLLLLAASWLLLRRRR